MQVLLEDIKRTLGAKRIYLPGSVEENKYLTRVQNYHKHGAAIKEKEDSRVETLEVAVEGLGLIDVDSAVDVTAGADGSPTSAPASSRRSRLGGLLGTSGESDKENLPVLRSRMIKVKEGRTGQLEMVGVP